MYSKSEKVLVELTSRNKLLEWLGDKVTDMEKNQRVGKGQSCLIPYTHVCALKHYLSSPPESHTNLNTNVNTNVKTPFSICDDIAMSSPYETSQYPRATQEPVWMDAWSGTNIGKSGIGLTSNSYGNRLLAAPVYEHHPEHTKKRKILSLEN